MGQSLIDLLVRGKDEASGALGGVTNSLKGMGKVGKALGGVMAATAAAVAAAGVAAVKMGVDYAESADQVGKMSIRLGISTEALSAFGFAAERSGLQAKQMQIALQRMTRRAAEAAKGTGEAQAAFKELNINAEQFAKLSPDQQFRRFGQAIGGVSNQADRVRLAFKLFDAEGVGVLQMLENGVDGFDAMIKEAKELGVVITDDGAKAAAEFNNAWLDARKALEGARNEIGVKMLPALTTLLGKFTDFAKEHRADFIAAIEAGVSVLGDLRDMMNELAEKVIPPAKKAFNGFADFFAEAGVKVRNWMDDQKGAARGTTDWSNVISDAIENSETLNTVLDRGREVLDNAGEAFRRAKEKAAELDATTSAALENTLKPMFEFLEEKTVEPEKLSLPVKMLGEEFQNLSNQAVDAEVVLNRFGRGAIRLFGDNVTASFRQMSGGFADAFADMAVNQKKFNAAAKQLWKSFATQAVAQIARVIAKLIALAILQALTGAGALSTKNAKKISSFLGLGGATSIGDGFGGSIGGGGGEVATGGGDFARFVGGGQQGAAFGEEAARANLDTGPQGTLLGGGQFGGQTMNIFVQASTTFGDRKERLAVAEEVAGAIIESGALGTGIV